jgi:guanylate kinase
VATPASSKEPPAPPIVVIGPSGVGKGTLIARLMAELPGKVAVTVSHTTRRKRPEEQEGVQYHFTDRADFEAAVARGEFLEYAEVHGNLYGTSKSAVDACSAQGKVAVLEIDVQVRLNPPFSSTRHCRL